MSGRTKLNGKQEALIAALLTEPTHAAAATNAGVSEATLHRWLRLPDFLSVYRAARRELVEGAIGRIQAASGLAVDTLVSVAKDGAKDSDRVRAAVALLDHAFRDFEPEPIALPDGSAAVVEGTGDVVKLLAERLRQVDAADLATAEKARLTTTLGAALLRAIEIDVLDKRLVALESVVLRREGKE